MSENLISEKLYPGVEGEHLPSTADGWQKETGGRPGMLRPGATSFASDFGLTTYQPSAQRSLIRATLTDKLRDVSGAAATGVLMTVLDIVASDPALIAAAPNWTATQDLTLYGGAPIVEGPIVADARLVRAGKKVVVVSVDVYDAHGETDLTAIADLIDRGDGRISSGGSALVTFARIPRAAAVGADKYSPASSVGTVRERPAVPLEGTIYERLGMREVDRAAGIVELDLTSFVVNQIGTIQGGALAVLAEYAACGVRPAMVACDMQIHYLAQVRTGPARSSCSVVRDADDHSVVNVRLVDRGNDNTLLALTTVTLRRRRTAGS